MGRAQDAKDFLQGLAAGVLHQSTAGGSEAFLDGAGTGRMMGRQALSEYLNLRGYDPLGEVTIEQILE